MITISNFSVQIAPKRSVKFEGAAGLSAMHFPADIKREFRVVGEILPESAAHDWERYYEVELSQDFFGLVAESVENSAYHILVFLEEDRFAELLTHASRHIGSGNCITLYFMAGNGPWDAKDRTYYLMDFSPSVGLSANTKA
jgi:hypothetical protein